MIRLLSTLLLVIVLSECEGTFSQCMNNCVKESTSFTTKEHIPHPEAEKKCLPQPEAEKKGLLDPFAKILSCQDCSLSDVTRDLQKWNQHLLSEDERKTLIAIFVPSQPGKSESLRRTCDGMVDILKQQYNYAVELKTEDFLKASVEILTDIGDVYVKKADASSGNDKQSAYDKAVEWYKKAENEAKSHKVRIQITCDIGDVYMKKGDASATVEDKHAADRAAVGWYRLAMNEAADLKLPLTNPIRVRAVMGSMTAMYKMGGETWACGYAARKLNELKYGKKNAETEAYKAKLDARLVEYKC